MVEVVEIYKHMEERVMEKVESETYKHMEVVTAKGEVENCRHVEEEMELMVGVVICIHKEVVEK